MNKENISTITHLEAGDWVMVRSLEDIQKTLNRFKELKGCAFLEDMKQYCGTQQRVLKVMERFLDERDYQVKKAKGIVLLDGVYCQGTPVFGRCDRSCLSFWPAPGRTTYGRRCPMPPGYGVTSTSRPSSPSRAGRAPRSGTTSRSCSRCWRRIRCRSWSLWRRRS